MPSCLYAAFRLSWRTTTGAPSGITRDPGAGDCATTTLAAKPGTDPVTRQANPSCSSVPFAKTYACLRTSGTTSGSGTAAAGAAAGGAGVESVEDAAKASVPKTSANAVAITATRGKRPKTSAVIPSLSAEATWDSTPREREFDDVLVGLSRRREREHRRRPRGRLGRCVLPHVRDPGELLEPRHLLRIPRRPEPQMQVRTGRVPGRADEPHPLPGAHDGAVGETGVAVGEVTVDPLQPVERPEHEPSPAAAVVDDR